MGWVALEDYVVPACLIARHEQPEQFLHMLVSGSVKYEVNIKGRSRQFTANPGTTFILPRGVDEIRWLGPTQAYFHRL